MHISTANALAALDFRHLPESLQSLSRPFAELALQLVDDPNVDGPDLTAAINHLRAAKDLAVGCLARHRQDPNVTVTAMREALG